MKKIIFSALAVFCSAGFAGSYSDNGIVADSTQDKETKYKHFYVNAGVNGYQWSTPESNIPFGGTDSTVNPALTSSQGEMEADKEWALQPTLALGYQFLNTKQSWFTDLFGMENSVELRASYLSSDTSSDETYNGAGANQWLINGWGSTDTLDGYLLDSSTTDYDDTYQSYGIYYLGNKLIANRYINAPYFGVNFMDLTLNSSYDMSMVSSTDGSDTK